MDRRTVELRIAGQTVRVVSSADESELERLAMVVSSKLTEVAPGRAPAPHAALLAALALAHEVDAERRRREAVEGRTRDLLARLLGRIDATLAAGEAADEADRA
jgi:cell division protein ZapA